MRGGVVRKIQRHGAEHRTAVQRDLRGERVEVGQQLVTQPDVFRDAVVENISLIAETPNFARGIRAVRTEHRQERGVLHPARVEFPETEIATTNVVRIGFERIHVGQAATAFRIIAAPEPELRVVVDEKTADVHGPKGFAGGAEIHAFGNADRRAHV